VTPDDTPTSPTTAVTLAAIYTDLRDLHDEVQALRQGRADAQGHAEELAARLGVIEQLVPTGPPAAAPSYPYRYNELADWVDEVFARVAAGHRTRWCTNWAAHLEARPRLELLWHTWEAAMAAAPGAEPQWAAVDEWWRVRLDHHAAVLLDAGDGPFAGCTPARGTDPGRCSMPPRLAQRPLTVAHDATVAHLDAAARLRAHQHRTAAGAPA
jgi:hypothetical protein